MKGDLCADFGALSLTKGIAGETDVTAISLTCKIGRFLV
jgi:hypothetical protein